MRKLGVGVSFLVLAGCTNVHEVVKNTCDSYGWDSPQCEYTQQSALVEQRRQAATFNRTIDNMQRAPYRRGYSRSYYGQSSWRR